MRQSLRTVTRLFIATLATASLTACMDSQELRNNNSKTVQLYSGGKVVGQWTTQGAIEMTHNGQGAYYFRDAATGHLIQITGTVVITAW
jgi:outer membrane biogenesis lipoprotein LolB